MAEIYVTADSIIGRNSGPLVLHKRRKKIYFYFFVFFVLFHINKVRMLNYVFIPTESHFSVIKRLQLRIENAYVL